MPVFVREAPWVKSYLAEHDLAGINHCIEHVTTSTTNPLPFSNREAGQFDVLLLLRFGHPFLCSSGAIADIYRSPVGLKEAALDSPTFRASVVHFSDQVDIVERWLDGYVKSTSKLTAELSTLESLTSAFLSNISCPPNLSEAVIDYDYTLLAIKLYEESARAYWSSVLSSLRQSDHVVIEPIKAFINEEIRPFKVPW